MKARARFRVALLPALLAMVLALAAGGCGDDGGSGGKANGGLNDNRDFPLNEADAEVRDTFTNFEDAVLSGAGVKGCSMLTASARSEAGNLFGGSCERGIRGLALSLEGVSQSPSKILSIKRDGDTAVARISDAGRKAVDLPFVREDGEWKIATLGFPGAPPDAKYLKH